MRVRRTWSVLLVLFSVCTLLASSACGRTEARDPAASAPVPSSSGPSVPPGAKRVQPEAETPQQAIEAWFAAGDQMQTSGDAGQFLSLSTADCAYCGDFAEQVAAVHAAGGGVADARTVVRSVEGKMMDGQFVYVTSVVSAPTVLRESANAPPRRLKGGAATYVLHLRADDAGWRVAGFEERDR